MNDIVVKDEYQVAIDSLESMQKVCMQIRQMKHFQKLSEAEIFLMVQKARAIGLDPFDCVAGAIYAVNGKVEMSANTMNYLIRSAGHSVQKDPKSDENVCILHGKRRDNGDVWTCSFSISEAKKANIYKNSWERYPQDMLFARALSRLGRQLFPDVLKGCYVEGEISQAPPINSPLDTTEYTEVVNVPKEIEKINQSQMEQLTNVLSRCSDEYRTKVLDRMKTINVNTLFDMPVDVYNKLLPAAMKKADEYQNILKHYEEKLFPVEQVEQMEMFEEVNDDN